MIHQLPGLPSVNLVRDLHPEEKWVLRQWGLPDDRPLTDRDLKKAGVVRYADHRKRLEKHGLSRGHWHGGRRFWYPIEIAFFLLSLREEPPPEMTERSAKGLAVAHGTATPAPAEPEPATTKPVRRRRHVLVAADVESA
jgi:hypothetical protein